ncbi:MAG TPA: outer membrane beta-barrel protein [Anaeromyxobacter sp.]|nr:outer membrane beta-barrel protein [Anaeromyxobacter sp.]
MRARGSLAAALALALLSGGALAKDVPRAVATEASAAQALRVGGLLGFDLTDGESGLGLRVDGELPIQRIGPRIDLSAVGSLGFTRFSDSTTTAIGKYSQSTNIVKLVPAARFTIPLAPQLGVYGDAGLGLYWARTSIGTPLEDTSSNGVGVTMRFAVGGRYDVTERLGLGGELGWNPFLGDYSDDTVSVLASVVYRL